MSYDAACYDLASYFMPKTHEPEATAALAQHIQDCIEDWLRGYGPTEPPAHFVDHDYHAHSNDADKALWNSLKPEQSKGE